MIFEEYFVLLDLVLKNFVIFRAVTTIEADEAAASSDFLNNKRERERERERECKRQDFDFCSSKGYIRYVMPFRIFFSM